MNKNKEIELRGRLEEEGMDKGTIDNIIEEENIFEYEDNRR